MLERNLSDFFTSGHRFGEDELLLKFQFRILNGTMVVVAFFAFLFGLLSDLGVNPLGEFHPKMDYLLSATSIVLLIWLRGGKERFLVVCYLLFTVALAAFTSALLFVPQDEFRIIWFYLLVFAAYITAGVRAGVLYTVLSIVVVLIASRLSDLQLSQTAIVSALLGLVIGSLFMRIYTRKILLFERTVLTQKDGLRHFNRQLEAKVEQKTKELQELNVSLEALVEEKINRIREQENLMIAQSRLAAMGEMMSMIAHQWRQPLSTMTLMITNRQLQEMLAGKTPDECDAMLQKISDTMVYLSQTIDDFQTYFKPEKKRDSIAVCTLIGRVEHFVQPRLKLSRVSLAVRCEDAGTVETFCSEVVQVLINIVNNAVDAIIENRRDERRITIDVAPADETVLITVEDTGGGIKEEVLQRVFEPYFSTKSKNGTGLGLYMAKMIIEQHLGGRIEVHNGAAGAIFTLTIPRHPRGEYPLS